MTPIESLYEFARVVASQRAMVAAEAITLDKISALMRKWGEHYPQDAIDREAKSRAIRVCNAAAH